MGERRFWIGGYSSSMGGEATGIGLGRRRDDGGFEYLGPAVDTPNPSFLAHGVVDGILYAVDEGGARVEAFQLTEDDRLEWIGGAAVTGTEPCHLTVAPGRLYVCNYGDGSVDVFVLGLDGRIGELLTTLHGDGAKPHAHSTLVVGGMLLAADLGSDAVYLHRDDRRVGAQAFPAGTGPRDLALSPAGAVLLLGELSGELFLLDGHADITASVSLGARAGDHAAGLAVDSSGRRLYTALRGSDRIVGLRLSDLTVVADVPSGGDWPRHLVAVDEVLHVANQRSGTVTSFRLDPDSGVPTPLGPPEPVPPPTYLLPAS